MNTTTSIVSRAKTSATCLNGALNYGFDPVGNRLTRASTMPAVPASTESYDLNDRQSTHGFDDNGNTTSAEGKTYTYDYEDRIKTVTGPGLAISIVYDGDGNRVSKTVNGVETKYHVDFQNPTGYAQVLEELDGANQVQKIYAFGMNLLSIDQFDGNAWTQHFYGFDGQGSVRYLTDSFGTITDTYTYDAYGILIDRVGTTANNYMFGGQQFDPDLNLYYQRARYLDVNSGRFWSMDDFQGDQNDPLSLNKYAYGNNDPINNSDPSGNVVLLGVLGQLSWIMTKAVMMDRANPWEATAREIAAATESARTTDDPMEVAYYTLKARMLSRELDQKFSEITSEFVSDMAEEIWGEVFGTFELIGQGLLGAYDLGSSICEYAGGACFAAGTEVRTVEGFELIENIRVGDRVWTALDSSPQCSDTKIDERSWRLVDLILQVRSRTLDYVRVSTLIPENDVAERGIKDGKPVWIELTEMGVAGWADVVSVSACPTISNKPGRVVLSTFISVSNSLIQIGFNDGTKLECTNAHPFYSETQKGFVVADSLSVGESIRCANGTLNVASIEQLPTAARVVYNLEVETEHTYQVGQSQLLCHNSKVATCYIERPGMRERKIGNTSIHGTAQRTDSAGVHQRKVLRIIREMAATGSYERIFVNRSWRTATGKEHPSRARPDVIGVRKGGIIDAWEVASESDTLKDLKARLAEAKKLLAKAKRGFFKVK